MNKEKMIAPIVKLDNGRRVKAGSNNEMYFFYNTRKEETAKEICKKLIESGYDAGVGKDFCGSMWFARLKRTDYNW